MVVVELDWIGVEVETALVGGTDVDDDGICEGTVPEVGHLPWMTPPMLIDFAHVTVSVPQFTR